MVDNIIFAHWTTRKWCTSRHIDDQCGIILHSIVAQSYHMTEFTYYSEVSSFGGWGGGGGGGGGTS